LSFYNILFQTSLTIIAGSYDNEGIAIFCMLFTYTLWIKSVKTGSIFWSVLCSLAYFYMVSS